MGNNLSNFPNWDQLPNDILTDILIYLHNDLSTISNVSLLSKKYYTLINDDRYWEKVSALSPHFSAIQSIKTDQKTWKKCYQEFPNIIIKVAIILSGNVVLNGRIYFCLTISGDCYVAKLKIDEMEPVEFQGKSILECQKHGFVKLFADSKIKIIDLAHDGPDGLFLSDSGRVFDFTVTRRYSTEIMPVLDEVAFPLKTETEKIKCIFCNDVGQFAVSYDMSGKSKMFFWTHLEGERTKVATFEFQREVINIEFENRDNIKVTYLEKDETGEIKTKTIMMPNVDLMSGIV